MVVARREPGNRIGLLLLASGVAFACYDDAAGYAVLDYHVHGGKLPLGPGAVVIASELWSAIFLVLPLVILFFPDGTVPPRWRRVVTGYLAVCAMIVAILLAGGAWEVSNAPIVVNGKGQLITDPGPPGVPLIVFVVLLLAVLVFWVSSVVRQVLSWRRASGERRAQLKWLMAGSAVNRARYDADRTVAAFAGRLKDAVDLDSIQHDLAGAVHRALEPAHLSVWLSPQADQPASYD